MILLAFLDVNEIQKIDLALVTSLTALITGIYSIYHVRKTTYINAVTASRLKYMENLRNYITTFCGLILHTSSFKPDESEKKILDEKIDQLRYTIKLHLNRKNYFDNIFITQLDSISNYQETNNTLDIKKQLTQLTNYSQDIFSLEWDGIKLEASKGRLNHCQKKCLTNKHKKTYGKEN